MRAFVSTMLLVSSCLLGCGVTPRVDSAATIADGLPTVEVGPEDRSELELAVGRAMAAASQRRFDVASDWAAKALAIDPRSARARAVQGLALAEAAAKVEPPDLHGSRRAELELAIASRLAPDDPFVGLMRALFLAEIGHTSAAAEAAEAALRSAASGSAAERATLLGLAGRYRYELGEERAALPLLHEYVGLCPEDGEARYRLGCTLLRLASFPRDERPASLTDAMRKAEAANEAFLRCHQQDPADLEAALAATQARWRAAELADRIVKGARDEAERDALRASAAAHRQACQETLVRLESEFPDSAEPSFQLAVLAERTGEAAAATAAYERALQRDADHVDALLNLAARLADSDPSRAATMLRRALTAKDHRRSLSEGERRRIEAWLERVGSNG
ncbi:MAG: hypothetical protein U1F60_15540 [Planctomycetota bacterium]